MSCYFCHDTCWKSLGGNSHFCLLVIPGIAQNHDIWYREFAMTSFNIEKPNNPDDSKLCRKTIFVFEAT